MRKKVLVTAAVATVLFGGTIAAQATTDQPDGHAGGSEKSTKVSEKKRPQPSSDETYAQYSRMFERSAGQFGEDGQWAWNPQGNGESHIGWGSPKNWPPDQQEHFIHDGDWVMLDGWGNDEVYYELQVTKEQIGDVNCKNRRDLPIDPQGRQRYVKWNVPSEGYCMKTWGKIIQKPGDAVIDFGHTQVWTPPHSCSNPSYGKQTCIGQWESWSDNQGNPGKPIEKKLERQIQIAKGIGMAFTIDQSFPDPWQSHLKKHWNW